MNKSVSIKDNMNTLHVYFNSTKIGRTFKNAKFSNGIQIKIQVLLENFNSEAFIFKDSWVLLVLFYIT